MVTPGRNYILGATPIKERSEKAEALDRMLREVRSTLDFDLGRIYLDRQMYQGDIVKTCREHGLNWLIQAPNKGAAKELAKETPLSEECDYKKGVEFSDFDYESSRATLALRAVHRRTFQTIKVVLRILGSKRQNRLRIRPVTSVVVRYHMESGTPIPTPLG